MMINVDEKHIALDDPTRKFLNSLKKLREWSGLKYRHVARNIGTDITAIHSYEKGMRKPNLGTLMKLAEFFEQDLSASINYKIYHGKICASVIKRRLSRYGLTYPELSKLTGYNTERIGEAVNLKPHSSILCLWSVLEVIKHEDHMQDVRRVLLRKGPYRKVALR